MKGVVDGGKFSFASGTNISFLEDLYAEYKKNPEGVDPSMKAFFEGYEFAAANNFGGASEGGDVIEAKVEDFINLVRRLGHCPPI
mgnify:FL=1